MSTQFHVLIPQLKSNWENKLGVYYDKLAVTNLWKGLYLLYGLESSKQLLSSYIKSCTKESALKKIQVTLMWMTHHKTAIIKTLYSSSLMTTICPVFDVIKE